ncbi:MAG: DUF6544 family protein [Vicinamibacterales bacterium]
MPFVFRTLILVLIGLGTVLGLAEWRWRVSTDDTQARLTRLGGSVPVAAPGRRRTLPPPVARYFDRVLPTPPRQLRHVRIIWTGEFNTGTPGADRWSRFDAEQDFFPGAPGMVWDAHIRMAPGLTVRVRDALVAGEGSMRASLLGLYTVADRHGTPELAEASLQRYLAEAVWLPEALLPEYGVRWDPVDDTRARATVRAGHASASVEFRFGADGLVSSASVPARLYDDGASEPSMHPWQGRYLAWAHVGGALVPSDAVVEWLLADGPFAYWRGRPVSIGDDDAAS